MPSSSSSLRPHFEAVARLLADARDILDDHPDSQGPRAGADDDSDALDGRGWTASLLALTDDELDGLEAGGLQASWPATTPPSLRQFTEALQSACALPVLSTTTVMTRPQQHQRPRKQAQVQAFAARLLPLLTDARRVVDVGSGHGHLTRELQALVASPVVGLERNPRLVDRAEQLARTTTVAPTFQTTDVLADDDVFEGGDCVVGLHACGELGDVMVMRAAARGHDGVGVVALALVGCCLQKRRADEREPLSALPGDLGRRCTVPKALLGLSNLAAGDVGVEASRTENLAARERRLALRLLLGQHGVAVDGAGAEIAGLNRRAAHKPLGILVARAFALRGLPVPDDVAIGEAARQAAISHGRRRRCGLPRGLLGRLLEVFVLLDRAVFLEERGFQVAVGTLFGADVSARNLALFAHRDGPAG